ncbi:MAG: hypothetical protein KA264_07625 [Crocinitomicaceae bacterium]|nr:hypothetical protein [Crocinitomicaceae bacterium]
MKLKSKIILGFFASVNMFVYSQGSEVRKLDDEIKPRPATLQKILLESDNFPKKEKVLKIYNDIPFPSQYVDFGLNQKSFDPKNYTISKEELAAAGKSQGKMASLSKSAAGNVTGGLVDSTASNLPLQIDKYLKENQIAKKIAAKWLNIENGRAQLGTYMMSRALSGLSMVEKTGDKEGLGLSTYKANLLINEVDIMANSFVVINKLFFQENEPVARVARDLAILQAQKITVPALQQKAIESANLLYEKVKVGYTVFAKSFLYQLDWDANKAKLANDYFNNQNVNAALAFDTTTLFKMKFLGDESSSALVTFSLKEKRTEDQLIEIAVKRSLANAMVKLQKKYEAFRPTYRLSSTNPAQCEIGLKEGVQNGDKFEIIVQKPGKVANTFTWKKAGKLQVEKSAIVWDNIDMSPKLDSLGNQINIPNYTPFKGKVKKGYYIRIAG